MYGLSALALEWDSLASNSSSATSWPSHVGQVSFSKS